MTNLAEKYNQYLSTAPVNVEGLIKLFNLELDKRADLSKNVLGEIRRKDDGKYKISVSKNDHYYRQRFTMAHELGHFLLHSDKIGDGVDDNVKYRSVPEGNFYNQYISDSDEVEANKFAASVLMPERLLRSYIGNTPVSQLDIKYLANTFQVSPKAMEIRIKSLFNENP